MSSNKEVQKIPLQSEILKQDKQDIIDMFNEQFPDCDPKKKEIFVKLLNRIEDQDTMDYLYDSFEYKYEENSGDVDGWLYALAYEFDTKILREIGVSSDFVESIQQDKITERRKLEQSLQEKDLKNADKILKNFVYKPDNKKAYIKAAYNVESLQEKGYKFEGYEVTSFSNSYHFKKDDQSKYVWFADGEMTDYMRQITTEKLNAVDKLSSIKILRKNIETKLNEYADFYRELNIDIKSQVDILIRLIQEVDDPKLLAGVDKNMEKNMQKIKNDEGDLVDGLNELIGDLSFASHLGTEELHDLGVSNTMIDAVKNNRGELALIEENFPPEYNNQKDDMSHARELIQSKIDEIAKGSIDEMTKKLTVDF